jgi:hypothetical protein
LSSKLGIVGICWLLLNVGIDHFEERVIAWRNRVERFPAGFHELGCRNRRGGFEPDFAVKSCRDTRADAARCVDYFLDQFDGRLRIVVGEKGASGIDNACRLGPRDVKTTVWSGPS